MTNTLTGRVHSLWLGLDKHAFVTTRRDEVRVTFEGFVGDGHAGLTRPADSRTPHYPRGTPIRNTRQVSIVSHDELAAIASAMDLLEVQAPWLGANLVLDGVPRLTRLPPSTRLYFPREVTLVVDGENLPCTGPGKVIQAQYPDREGLTNLFPEAAMHLRGLVAWVERPGVIREGDEVRVEIPAQFLYEV